MRERGLRVMALVVIAAAALQSSGCVSSCVSSLVQARKARTICAAGVTAFHAKLDAGEYDAIFEQCSPEWREASNYNDTVKLMQGIHTKLGSVQQTKELSFMVNWNTGGNFATLTYETQFANGKGTERFVWRVDGSQPSLVAYNINSNALMAQ